MMEVKKVAEEQEIWNEEEKTARSEVEVKKLVPDKFYKTDKSIWEEAIREDTNKEGVGSCNRCKEDVCTKKREDISIVKRGKRRSKRICKGAIEKRIYPTVKVTTDGTGILCGEEEQKEKDSVRLQVLK